MSCLLYSEGLQITSGLTKSFEHFLRPRSFNMCGAAAPLLFDSLFTVLFSLMNDANQPRKRETDDTVFFLNEEKVNSRPTSRRAEGSDVIWQRYHFNKEC